MDFKVDRESAVSLCSLVDTDITQTAEHNFILPDYCPNIFKVLKCFVVPGVTSAGINGSKLTFELNVLIRVLYRSDNGESVYCVEHTHEYSKSIDLPADIVNPDVSITPSVEYVNCRVADSRKLDVRAGIICKVKVTGEKKCSIVCGAYGEGIQLRKSPVFYASKRITCAKRITVIEELELAAGKPAFGSSIRCSAQIRKGEQKIIPGKLITKGEADVNLLYLAKDASEKPPEKMSFSIPFSQIIDIEGIEDSFETSVNIAASKCVIIPKSDENSSLECELILLVSISAVKFESAELVSDAYSTQYETECKYLEAMLPQPVKNYDAQFSASSIINCADGSIKEVYDLWTENEAVNVSFDEKKGCFNTFERLTFCMLGQLDNGTAIYLEKECAVEQPLENETDSSYNVTAKISQIRCSYTLGEGNTIQAKAEINAKISSEISFKSKLLSDIIINEGQPKARDKRCAVKICYTSSNESVWDIAKKILHRGTAY